MSDTCNWEERYDGYHTECEYRLGVSKDVFVYMTYCPFCGKEIVMYESRKED